MKGISNNNVSNILLNSQFNYHSRYPKSILKSNSRLLKQSNSELFDYISDVELNKRIELAYHNAQINRNYSFDKDTIAKSVINQLKHVMPMKTRSQYRKEKSIVDTVNINVNDYEMDDMVDKFQKVSSKDADLQDLMVKMDKALMYQN